jgi:hypothetical protein
VDDVAFEEFISFSGPVVDRASGSTPLLQPGQSANWIASSSRKVTGEIACRVASVRYERV